ncbi:Glucagon-like peptide 1 receptor [Liparis tanakae]|uniref:Glucagon-like peptide 1 receptor n=1 Tax=Liparis tanakae TaxID=230148 RepID=A0A4Z2I0Z0_9TELE|nr:Glucagon-like peptide 1 receptor [Liparis tanakae]
MEESREHMAEDLGSGSWHSRRDTENDFVLFSNFVAEDGRPTDRHRRKRTGRRKSTREWKPFKLFFGDLMSWLSFDGNPQGGETGSGPPHVSGLLCVLAPTDPHPPSVSGMSQVSSTNSLELVKEQWSGYKNQCLNYHNATPSTTGLVCNRTFDLYACWPDGLPGTTVNVSCPWFLPWYRKVQQGLVYRFCNEEGHWAKKNTSECEDDPGEQQYGRILSQLRVMYTVGYSLSLGALLLALGILITFRYDVHDREETKGRGGKRERKKKKERNYTIKGVKDNEKRGKRTKKRGKEGKEKGNRERWE